MWFRGLVIAAALATAIQAPAPATAAPLADTVTVGVDKYGIALMPGAVFTTNAYGEFDPPRSSLLVRNSLSGSGTTVVAGPAETIGEARTNMVAASAYRVMSNGRIRYGTGEPKSVDSWVEALSGTRAVVTPNRTMTSPFNLLYDVRTGVRETDGQPVAPWRYGTTDVFGNYVAYSRKLSTSTQVRRRDLATGTDIVVGTVGSAGVVSVAIRGNLVAWVTGCPNGRLCSQTVSYRVVGGSGALGAVRSFRTVGTNSLDLSATHVALDTVTARREIRLVALGTHTIRVIGALPKSAGSGSTGGIPVEYPGQTPVHFDLDNDRIGWLDENQNAKVTALGTPPARARYLGNGVIPAWFTPNGDGDRDRFGASLSFSKNLTLCSVTFRRGTAPVRVVPCVVRNGDVLISWDGRDSAGRPVPKGRYQWTLTGSDPAGAVLWYTGSGAPIRATVEVR